MFILLPDSRIHSMPTTADPDTRTLAELMPPENERTITVSQAAKLTGRPLNSGYEWMRTGRLEAWKVFGRSTPTV